MAVRTLGSILLLCLLVAVSRHASPAAAQTHQVSSFVIGAAGSSGQSSAHRVRGTAGQATPVGAPSSAGFRLRAGFWNVLSLYTTPVEPDDVVLYRDALLGSHPNPFTERTTIAWTLARGGPVELRIYDASGRRIRTLADVPAVAGPHQAVWDARDDAGVPVAPGIYFYRLRGGSLDSSRKLLLVR